MGTEAARSTETARTVGPGSSPRRLFALPARSRRELWLRRAALTTAGETAGFAVPAAAAAAFLALDPPDVAVLPMAAAGAAEGAVLGLAQAAVLLPEVQAFRRRDWVVATSAAALASWSVGMSLGTQAEDLPVAALVPALVLGAGAILASVGLAQWIVLRRHVPRAERWIAANALAWLAGLVAPLAAMGAVGEGDPAVRVVAAGVASGLAMGAIVAALTGLALVRLLRPGPWPRLRLAGRIVNPAVIALLRSPLHRPLSSSLLLLAYRGRRSGRRRTLPGARRRRHPDPRDAGAGRANRRDGRDRALPARDLSPVEEPDDVVAASDRGERRGVLGAPAAEPEALRPRLGREPHSSSLPPR